MVHLRKLLGYVPPDDSVIPEPEKSKQPGWKSVEKDGPVLWFLWRSDGMAWWLHEWTRKQSVFEKWCRRSKNNPSLWRVDRG